jgi:5'-phosphate synthase pdxT subunit
MSGSFVVGVLALQGAFRAHELALAQIGVDTLEVRTPEQLARVGAIVLPGGESTTMSKLLVTSGLLGPLRDALRGGLPAFGTCAGLIMLADTILDGRGDETPLGALDVSVRRNAYGRQRDSFERDIDVDGLDVPFRAVFIRAPRIERIGAGVEVLATCDDVPVLVRSGAVWAASFHPELTDDSRIHALFVHSVAMATGKGR